MFETRLLVDSLICVLAAALKYIEQRQLWTLQLSISRLLCGWTWLAVTLAAVIKSMLDLMTVYPGSLLHKELTRSIAVVGFFFLCFRLLLPLAQNAAYIDLRWKAWTGPSRTGIAPTVTRYLGDKNDWKSLASVSQRMEMHPVESFLRWAIPFGEGIPYDPTEILRTRLKMDEEADTFWLPRSENKAGVYAPIQSGKSVSLLWGEDLGFMRRCSRGIIAVPTPLLSFHPRLKSGVDGRPLCLAHGILARNKGLEPSTLVCNLQTPSRLRGFEENSALWPRPAKTLRSCYHKEMSQAFSGLGQSFVCAATELALLLADAKSEKVADWLESHMEHQDLRLNNQAATLGASVDELSRLYRGQYVAMLISLSEHKAGVRTRPELTVFRALCAADGIMKTPTWLNEASMRNRLSEEERDLGARGSLLIEAAV
ncbi:hypothetical protein H2202_003994 [Exophiala xenobiotica]|nr:hypothetical protein H2202_003994 [Exophiala xenobiotica]KAK5189142.1 hypothetical protein LTR92_010884 [Exophiala xenobiotica]KAK5238197.1 hypothetical protein LTR47_001290 [Exophiala xenobiotica]KAK5243516.1 hypothetical protein LTS06_010736 [Exophiala xenobiotica]KAK5355949.1 hypothetical protein LTR61_001622 [Exophiala xenobiotica]